MATYFEKSHPVMDYYRSIGRLRCVDADADLETVYARARAVVQPNFVYASGTEGMQLARAMDSVAASYASWATVDARALYRAFVARGAGQPDWLSKVQAGLDSGALDIDASVSCSIVLDEVARLQSAGFNNFVFVDFPRTVKQKNFLEKQTNGSSRAVVFEYAARNAVELGALAGQTQAQAEADVSAFAGAANQDFLASVARCDRVDMDMPRCERHGLPAALVVGSGVPEQRAARGLHQPCVRHRSKNGRGDCSGPHF